MLNFFGRYLIVFILMGAQFAVFAQTPSRSPDKPREEPNPLDRVQDFKYASITSHQVTVNGKVIPYKTTAAVLPAWDDAGKTMAGIYYTYFERTDVKNKATRPLIFSFNGGPGSASVWMMIGYTGPRLLNIDDEGYPIQPYGLRDNPYSIIDVADIVYVDPVNTGFSRPLNKDIPREKFFGINTDIKYLADWINNFINVHQRWASPKFLIGESYGTTRVSGLALELQNAHWMYLNGVILVSPTGLGIERDGPVAQALRLPYFAATAWYHKALPPDLQSQDLPDLLKEVESFTIQEYLPALAMGGSQDAAGRKGLTEKVSRYSGLSKIAVEQNNLIIPFGFFWKELLRDKGYTIGRLDSRYLGIDSKDAGNNPEYNAELTAWLQAFTPAINMYLRDELAYKTSLKYNMFGPVHPWNNDNDNTGNNLRQAMAQNPYLHVMVQSGYYDGGTDYFSSKYNLWQLDAIGRLKDRLRWEGYRSGHMMYLRKDDLKTSTDHIRSFIKDAVAAAGKAARYGGQ